MISKLLAVFALTYYLVAAQTSSLSLPVTQDFAVSNNGYSGAQISLPDSLSFFNNGFQSSVAYFGIDLAPLAVYDTSTISSATLTFTNYTISQGSSATIAVTLLNYGQVFDESTITLNTQPTSQGSLGSATFTTSGSATIDVTSKLVAAQAAGGLFGFRVDPPGGPVAVASHRVNANAVYIAVEFGGTPATTTTQASATTTTTVAPVPSTNSPGSPSTTTTAAPTPANCWTCGAGWVHWYQVPGMAQPGSDPCACIKASTTTTTTKAPASGSTTTTTSGSGTTTTTAAAPTSGPTSSFSPSGSSPSADATAAPSSTDAPRSAANRASVALLCIVPMALALLL